MVLKRRAQLPPEDHRRYSRRICERIATLTEYQNARWIYAYIPFRGEVDITELLLQAWREGRQVAVPRVIGRRVMEFYPIREFSDLEEGTFGVREPKGGEPVDIREALMVMPGAVFDEQCNRIGYGGGYYDVYLEAHSGHPTVAAAFELQILRDIPADPYDKKPQMIATEQRLLIRQEGLR